MKTTLLTPSDHQQTGELARCSDCGAPIGHDAGPPDGWQLEDGRIVCHKCCVRDTGKFIAKVIKIGRQKSIGTRQFLKVTHYDGSVEMMPHALPEETKAILEAKTFYDLPPATLGLTGEKTKTQSKP